jgi:outer membrane protein TolC
VIEAQQTVEKARAATKVSKLDYVPDIAVIGGWAFQDDVVPLLPNNFGYVGVMGSYNIFNFGKREYSIKERGTQLKMARTALELTKAQWPRP